MKKSTMVGIGVAMTVGVFAVLGFGTMISAANEGAQLENQIKATQDDNRQILGQYTTRIGEMAQVPAMARDDLRLVMESAFQGRYGEDGSQAVFQWIREAYPGQVDSQLYRNIQVEMSSGRVAFASAQTRLLDQKRIYQTKLDQPISGFWLKLVGYPKTDLDSITIVSSTAANRAFETGVDDGVTLRPTSAGGTN